MTTAPPAPATTTALARIEMPPWASEALRPYMQDAQFELLLPALPVNSQLGKGFMPSISIVRIDPDPAAGDVYKVGSKRAGQGWEDVYAYAKPALERLAGAAGIQIRTKRADDRKDPDLCEFEAFGGMRNESGEIVMRSGSASVRLSQYSEDRWTEIQAANEKAKAYKKDKPEAELRDGWKSEMAQYRKHFASRVETKAALRAIRSLLAIKSQLTAEQVRKPKVVVRISLDTRDPEIRGALMTQGLMASTLLFGQGQPSTSHAEEVQPERAALPATAEPEDREPLGLASVVTDAPTDPRKAFSDACGAIGLGFVEAADILAENGMDHAKAAAAIERMTNERANG